MSAVHRLAAHDNSVTSLQFDESRIVSGGSDGRVKVWDLRSGVLVRELGVVAEAVWRVVFEEEKAVVLASRGGKTVMEVWSFAPPSEDGSSEANGFKSHASSPGPSMYQDDHRSSSYRTLEIPTSAHDPPRFEDPQVARLRTGRTHRETSEMLLHDQGDAVMEDVFDPLRGFGALGEDDKPERIQTE
jgi:F-box and WD-40 domain protein CDC4